ncbi:hypothetical protein MMC07_006479 [Pseudocyphellaria aurata]|nr:hypothetical protein [Pseudocyphellaria aurata]
MARTTRQTFATGTTEREGNDAAAGPSRLQANDSTEASGPEESEGVRATPVVEVLETQPEHTVAEEGTADDEVFLDPSQLLQDDIDWGTEEILDTDYVPTLAGESLSGTQSSNEASMFPHTAQDLQEMEILGSWKPKRSGPNGFSRSSYPLPPEHSSLSIYHCHQSIRPIRSHPQPLSISNQHARFDVTKPITPSCSDAPEAITIQCPHTILTTFLHVHDTRPVLREASNQIIRHSADREVLMTIGQRACWNTQGAREVLTGDLDREQEASRQEYI